MRAAGESRLMTVCSVSSPVNMHVRHSVKNGTIKPVGSDHIYG